MSCRILAWWMAAIAAQTVCLWAADRVLSQSMQMFAYSCGFLKP